MSKIRTATVAFFAAAIFSLLSAGTLSAHPGAVYTMTNSASSNEVVAYSRASNGSLSAPRYFATGGKGLGAGLGSQDSIAMTDDGNWLLAVNAGSNDVSVFSVEDDGGLTLAGRTASGGVEPISVTQHGAAVFVLNAGGTPNITGFRLTRSGSLVAIPGATASLSGTGPAQVSFDDHGLGLVVTDKTSNTIEVFGRSLLPGLRGPIVTKSSGSEPFGFAFGHRDVVVVSEAAGGAPNLSTVSSYQLEWTGHLRPISAAVPIGQTAACWVAVTNDGRLAFVANTGSSSISALAIGPDGSLKLLKGAAGMTLPGTATTDLALDNSSQHLYALASGTISAFSVSNNGTLTSAGTVSDLPASAVGLAAR